MIPLIAPRRLLLAISAALVLISLALLLAVGVNLGIDFTSGSLARVELGVEGERDAIETALLSDQIPGAEVQASDGSTYLIRTAELTDVEKDRMEEILSRAYPAFELISFDFVGPVIGAELTRNAALAVAAAER